MRKIHPAAVVDKNARLGEDVEIGPFCHIGSEVTLGDGCIVDDGVSILGNTTIGKNCHLYPRSAMGADPQDRKFQGGDTPLVIGDDNHIREMVTIHRGTETGGGITKIGNDNHIMVGVHVAHDTVIGSGCTIGNYVQLAGHLRVEDNVNIGGMCAFHHFVTIGRNAYLGGMSRVPTDIAPFMISVGYPATVRGVNAIGMSRNGYSPESVQSMTEAYKVLFSRRARANGRTLLKNVLALEARGNLDENVAYLCRFIRKTIQEGVKGRYRESKRHDRPPSIRGRAETVTEAKQ